ncbi:hypothetical protein HIM_08561 [Hirsutella minnesotensis 3608]|uniref:Peroxisomal ATPase PEX1 n=1 Tax=Hirsutella minnesotensis 3608 TaxID=1043627 RepID=A0A0F7ZMF0_9HYPO|nr:hypothetical protein HIM_08561 [Hirsutella minnesotensis 3608]
MVPATGPTLSVLRFRNNLDRDVYHIIKKLETDDRPFKTIAAAYDAIKRSNSSLSRQKKRPLEDAIDRALRILKQEQQDSDTSEAAIDEPEPHNPEDGRFLLNRQMAKLWNIDPAKPREDGAPGAKKRRLQHDADDNESRANGITNGTEAAANGSTREAQAASSNLDKQQTKKNSRSGRFSVEQPGQLIPLGGLDQEFRRISALCGEVLFDSELFKSNSLPLTSGILVSGPPSVGKKSLVRNLASTLGVPLISLTGCFYEPEKMEKSLSDAFDTAISLAPSIVFIERLEKCMPRPDSSNHHEHHARALLYFENQMARIRKASGLSSHVLALATTSKLTDVNPEALRSDLFEETIQIRIPDCSARLDTLGVLTRQVPLANDVRLQEIATMTHGYVGSDLRTILKLAGRIAVERSRDAEGQVDAKGVEMISSDGLEPSPDTKAERSQKPIEIRSEDLKSVIKNYTPSLRTEGFTVIPSITWDQVGAMEATRKQLRTSIIGPIKHPDLYQRFGLTKPAGVLLWGPPGCGKTLVAQAVANEAQASFILINGPELLNKYVGESERAVRELFQRAKSSTPCILFFDEIDSIAPPRNSSSTDSGVRVVNALLTELDGAQDRTGIYVIGATNRPDMIDEAMLRPGRLSIQLLVDIPTPQERVDILRTIYRTRHENPRPEHLDHLTTVALDTRCTGFSGADLSGLHDKAAEHALERWLESGDEDHITESDWEYGLAGTQASVRDVDSYRIDSA